VELTWRKLSNDEPDNLQSSRNSIRGTKSKSVILVGH